MFGGPTRMPHLCVHVSGHERSRTFLGALLLSCEELQVTSLSYFSHSGLLHWTELSMEPEETPSDEERRREVRRAYNRENAQRARQRTKDKITTLTSEINSLEDQEAALLETNRQLQREVQRLQHENNLLRLSAGLPLRDQTTNVTASSDLEGQETRALPMARPEQASLLSLLAASQQGTASRPFESGDNRFAPQLAMERSIPALSIQLGAFSSHLATQRQRDSLRLPPRDSYPNSLRQQLRHQQRIFGGLAGTTRALPAERGVQAVALMQQQAIAASGMFAQTPSTVAGQSDETARLLELLRQQRYGGVTNAQQQPAHPPEGKDGDSSSHPSGSL